MIGISAYVLNQRLALAMPYVAQLAYEHLIIPSLTPIFFLHINMYPWIEAPITGRGELSRRDSPAVGGGTDTAAAIGRAATASASASTSAGAVIGRARSLVGGGPATVRWGEGPARGGAAARSGPDGGEAAPLTLATERGRRRRWSVASSLLLWPEEEGEDRWAVGYRPNGPLLCWTCRHGAQYCFTYPISMRPMRPICFALRIQ